MNALVNPVGSSAVEPVEQPLLFQFCRIAMPQGEVLGEDALRLVQFQGHENASDLFEYQLELHGDTDEAGTALIDFSEVLGQEVTVGVACARFANYETAHHAFIKALAEDDTSTGPFAFFHGIVASIALDIPGVYRVTMRPRAWRMSLTNRYEIYHQKNIVAMITELCTRNGFVPVLDALADPANLAQERVQDWMQAGESDLDMLHRLMGKAHIYFYFRHRPSAHEMVFSNVASYPAAIPGETPLRYTYTEEEEDGLHQADLVTQYSFQQSLGSTGVHSVFTQQSEAWDVNQPSRPLASFSNFEADSPNSAGDLPFRQYKIVQYGFSTSQVREFAETTDQALRTATFQLSGASRCPFLRVGHRFKMVSDVPGVRPEINDVEFVLTQVQHTSSLDGDYQNQFSATLASGLISSASIQDTQQGVVLAKVTDADGNDKVKNWPYYQPDEFTLANADMTDARGVPSVLKAKGVYVRFSTAPEKSKPVFVKLASHMQGIPEVGSCVWITRANDESELPEIQNMVQADGNKTIVDPDYWTAHSQVGNNYSTAYGDSRSIRFRMTWTAADVERAAKIVNDAYGRKGKPFRDASYSRGGSYGYSESDDRADGVLSESWSWGSTYNNSWSKVSKSFSAAGRTYHESVTGKYDDAQQSTEETDAEALAAVSASRSKVYGNTYSNSTSNGDTKSITEYNGQVDSETTHNGKVISNTTINGDSDNTSTITGTSTNTSVHHIVHNFSTVDAQSSSNKMGAVNSNDLTGVTNTNALTGVSNRNSLTGVNLDIGLQGISTNTSITGMENRLSVTGMNNSLSVTGESNSVEVVGASTSVKVSGPGVQVSVESDQAKVDLNGPVMQIPVIVLVL